jgi:hypothetical protein
MSRISSAKLKQKQYTLDRAKIKRAQKLLGTSSEEETIERALDEVIADRERNRAAWRGHNAFLKSGIQIKDVYGKLE